MSARVIALTAILIAVAAVLVFGGFKLWGVLAAYIAPEDATGRKDLVQAFGLIVAGVVGLIGVMVGLVGLYLSRRNLQNAREALQQQREIEDQRAQDTALQAFFEQIGGLLTDQDLLNTERKDITLLAQAQTQTMLRRLDAGGKGHLLSFLHGSGLIDRENVVVSLRGADLSEATLSGANLGGADLSGANLSRANLREAGLSGANLNRADLSGADLSGAYLLAANLSGANLSGANLSRANLRGASGITKEQLTRAASVEGATLPIK